MSDNRETIIEQIRTLRPWHQNIRLSDDLEIKDAFSETELERANNDNVSLIDPSDTFAERLGLIYPDGLAGKRFLDCACNAGCYCFYARALEAEQVFGFDVREHWINQAKFVQQNRTCEPVDKIQFEVRDLMTLPSKKMEPADLTLFKGIFYHLADPILGLKIAANLTREVLWFNSARCFKDDSESLYCIFEKPENVMSGVHSLSWTPSGPSVIGKMLYWLGFHDIRHVYSKENPNRPGFGRMEIIAARRPGMLDRLGEELKAETIDIAKFPHSRQATEEVMDLF